MDEHKMGSTEQFKQHIRDYLEWWIAHYFDEKEQGRKQQHIEEFFRGMTEQYGTVQEVSCMVSQYLTEYQGKLRELDDTLQELMKNDSDDEEERKKRRKRMIAWILWYDWERKQGKPRFPKIPPELLRPLLLTAPPQRLEIFLQNIKAFLIVVRSVDEKLESADISPKLAEAEMEATLLELYGIFIRQRWNTIDEFLGFTAQAQYIVEEIEREIPAIPADMWQQMQVLQGAVKVGEIFAKEKRGWNMIHQPQLSANEEKQAKDDILFGSCVKKMLQERNDPKKCAAFFRELSRLKSTDELKAKVFQSKTMAQTQKVVERHLSIEPVSIKK
ncbi:MAG: hypothetical protein KBS74_01745 [Clostridiales bacterium]|nr:hypothetical protein [Candidatus Cacconaster stercorequi]